MYDNIERGRRVSVCACKDDNVDGNDSRMPATMTADEDECKLFDYISLSWIFQRFEDFLAIAPHSTHDDYPMRIIH